MSMPFRALLLFLLVLFPLHSLLRAQTAGTGLPTPGSGALRPWRALIVGIRDQHRPGLPGRAFARADAEALAALLHQERLETGARHDIRLLLDEDATLSALLDGLHWLQGADEDTDVLFYFAGSLALEEENTAAPAYLLAHDSPGQPLRGLAMPASLLDQLAAKRPQGPEHRTLFIVDAPLGRVPAGARPGPLAWLGRAHARECRLLSSRADQLPAEGLRWGGGHGAFTYHLIRGWNGAARPEGAEEPSLSLQQLQQYLQQQLGKEQTPVIHGPRGTLLTRATTAALRPAPDLIADTLPPVSAPLPPLPRFEPTRNQAHPAPLLDLIDRFALLRLLDSEALLAAESDSLPALLPEALYETLSWIDLPEETRALWDSLLQREESAYATSSVQAELARELARRIHTWGQFILGEYVRHPTLPHPEAAPDPLLCRLGTALLPAAHPLVPFLALQDWFFSGRILAAGGTPAARAQALALHQQALNADAERAFVHFERGMLYVQAGQPALAETALRQALRLSPAWAPPYARMSGLWREQGRIAESRQLAQRGLLLVADSRELHGEIGQGYLEQKHYFLAEHHLLQALQADPGYLPAHRALGELYLAIGEIEQAEQAFRTAAEGPVAQPPPAPAVAQAIPLEADSVYIRAIDRNPFDTKAYYEWGQVHALAGRWAEAEKAFRMVLLLRQAHPLIRDQLAWLYLRQGRHAEAALAVEAALDRFGETTPRLLLQARIQEDWGRTQEALDRYQRLSRQSDAPAEVFARWGKLTAQQGISPEAVWREFARRHPLQGGRTLRAYALEQAPRFPQASKYWTQLALEGLCYACLGTPPDGAGPGAYPPDSLDSPLVEVYYFALEATPADAPPLKEICLEALQGLQSLTLPAEDQSARAANLHGQARILRHLGQLNEARKTLETALQRAPGHPEMRMALIELARSVQDREAILRHQEVLWQQQQLPYPELAGLTRSRLLLGQIAGADSLMTRLREAFPLIPKTEEGDALGARILWLGGDTPAAEEAYRAMAKDFPRSPYPCYQLGRIALEAGEQEKALEWLGKALERGLFTPWVLALDPAIDPLRQRPEWNQLLYQYGIELPTLVR